MIGFSYIESFSEMYWVRGGGGGVEVKYISFRL